MSWSKIQNKQLSAKKPDKKFCTVDGNYSMAYVEMIEDQEEEQQEGETLVFLHGNPTSSYLWRNVMTPLQGSGRRLIAPDLMGMGDSDKLEDSSDEAYSFANHSKYLDQFLNKCIDTNDPLVLVLHDWGSGLGFLWAYRNPERVKGVAYMEAMTEPLSYSDFDNQTQSIFQQVRTPGVGETLILEQNFFVEQMLPPLIMRNLTEEEMAVYREPYLIPGESRRPTLTWPRELPLDGEPADNAELVSKYSAWMSENEIPKLLISADPGVLLIGEYLENARSWPNQVEVTVNGLHFIQEDSPTEIADAIDNWLASDMFSEGVLPEEPSSSPIGFPSGVVGDTYGSAHLLWFTVAMLIRFVW